MAGWCPRVLPFEGAIRHRPSTMLPVHCPHVRCRSCRAVRSVSPMPSVPFMPPVLHVPGRFPPGAALLFSLPGIVSLNVLFGCLLLQLLHRLLSDVVRAWPGPSAAGSLSSCCYIVMTYIVMAYIGAADRHPHAVPAVHCRAAQCYRRPDRRRLRTAAGILKSNLTYPF